MTVTELFVYTETMPPMKNAWCLVCGKQLGVKNTNGRCREHRYANAYTEQKFCSTCLKPLNSDAKYDACQEHRHLSPTWKAYRREYYSREDRVCRIKGCLDFALKDGSLCRQHHNEKVVRRWRAGRTGLHQMLFDRQDGLCPDADHGGCGLRLPDIHKGVHLDHLVPQVHGGPDAAWNYQLMHAKCNLSKSDRIVPAAEEVMRNGTV